MKSKKVIIALTSIGLVAVQLTNAQALSSTQSAKAQAHGIIRNHINTRKAIEEAILSGDFTSFQTVASTSPLKTLDQNTFNLLSAQFTAKKNAETQIRNILKSAGIEPKKNNLKQILQATAP